MGLGVGILGQFSTDTQLKYRNAFRFYQLAAEQSSATAHLKLGMTKAPPPLLASVPIFFGNRHSSFATLLNPGPLGCHAVGPEKKSSRSGYKKKPIGIFSFFFVHDQIPIPLWWRLFHPPPLLSLILHVILAAETKKNQQDHDRKQKSVLCLWFCFFLVFQWKLIFLFVLGDYKFYGLGTEVDIPLAAQYYQVGSDLRSPQVHSRLTFDTCSDAPSGSRFFH